MTRALRAPQALTIAGGIALYAICAVAGWKLAERWAGRAAAP